MFACFRLSDTARTVARHVGVVQSISVLPALRASSQAATLQALQRKDSPFWRVAAVATVAAATSGFAICAVGRCTHNTFTLLLSLAAQTVTSACIPWLFDLNMKIVCRIEGGRGSLTEQEEGQVI
jgi:anti-sigma-K factor RskA